MSVQLKPLSEQTIVITGASSGIGLATARLAAKQGARLVLAARSEEALRQLTDEITQAGGEATYVAADVGSAEDVRRIATEAVNRFGGFDTWINNAGVSVYGKFMEVPIEDLRRLFETNFWGVVYGSHVAAEHLRARGGALINVGSTLSDRAIPLQGMYSASKHAVKGFTDALRMELEMDGAPVSVTLIKPAAINTPYTEHAKNYLEVAPQNPAPVYAPEVVAETILYCAEHPERDVFVGGGGKALSALGQYAPRLTDVLMENVTANQQKSDKPPRPREDNGLYEANNDLRERGNYEGHVAESSLYTKASLHPLVTGALLLGAGLAVGSLWRPKANGNGHSTKGDKRSGAEGRH
jgi:short-subunit dehydrogenase